MKTTCEYQNDGKRITQAGKFEGEPVFAPYYWDLALQGFADKDDGKVFTFKFSRGDLPESDPAFAEELEAWFGEAGKHTLRMSEDSQGFVHCF